MSFTHGPLDVSCHHPPELGVVIGVGIAAGTTRVLGNLLFGVEAADVGTFLGMSTTMMLVGLLASYLPARRASNVDPIEALRAD